MGEERRGDRGKGGEERRGDNEKEEMGEKTGEGREERREKRGEGKRTFIACKNGNASSPHSGVQNLTHTYIHAD